MKNIIQRLREQDWDQAAADLHQRGYASFHQVLTKKECEALIGSYDNKDAYRKTITMERYRFGLGEYSGGEFVLTEQVPRAQSKANVLRPGRGDMLLFTTQFRPVRGSKGYYRVNMKHGVSPLHSGNRHTLGIIFHDALS